MNKFLLTLLTSISLISATTATFGMELEEEPGLSQASFDHIKKMSKANQEYYPFLKIFRCI